jgi:hypothetical protein
MLQVSTTSKFFHRIKVADVMLEAVYITKITGFSDMIPCTLAKLTDVSVERATSIFWVKE